MTIFKKVSKLTNSLRHARLIERKLNFIWKKKPISRLVVSIKNNSGRNNTGKIVARTKGARARSGLRLLDHKKNILGVPGVVCRIEYDPFRSSFISLLVYSNGICTYVIHTYGLAVGSSIISSFDLSSLYFFGFSRTFHNGDSSSLMWAPQGTILHSIELFPGSGGVIARSAGTYCNLVKKFPNIRKCLIQLPSRSSISIPHSSFGIKGIVGNEIHYRVSLGKAGRHRNLGYKPTVRGVAMNPVDHPHGGGEGKKSKPCHPRTA
jgi:large subunit ribosomal protein L2